jgi:hypothetical protein
MRSGSSTRTGVSLVAQMLALHNPARGVGRDHGRRTVFDDARAPIGPRPSDDATDWRQFLRHSFSPLCLGRDLIGEADGARVADLVSGNLVGQPRTARLEAGRRRKRVDRGIVKGSKDRRIRYCALRFKSSSFICALFASREVAIPRHAGDGGGQHRGASNRHPCKCRAPRFA